LHRGLVTGWLIAWGVFVLWAWYPNRNGGGWFDASSVAVLTAIIFAIGVGVVLAIVVVARFALGDERARTLSLIVVPLSIVLTLVVWGLAGS
jgi:hypothetical protein